jgi:hypothetical protein
MKIFNVPYRWLPRTIIPNLLSCWDDISEGVRNIIRWTPVIWFDRDFDWEFLATILEFKLRNMSNNFGGTDITRLAQKDARRMLICAELLKRMRKDEIPPGVRLRTHIVHMDYYQEYFGFLIGKYLRTWWY